MNLIDQRVMMGAAAVVTSVSIAACGAHSTNQSTQTFTVFEDAPKMSLLDLGAPGNGLGDVYHFSAALHSERGGPVTGELIGSKTLVKMPTDADPNLERRATLMFFTFAGDNDQIIALGAADYAPSAPEFEAGRSAVRPVLGGTGKYIGAWPGHQHAQFGWFVHAGIHAAQVVPIEFLLSSSSSSFSKKPCRVDATADLTELENEPNCLDSRFRPRYHNSVYSLVIRPLRRMHSFGPPLA